MIEFCGLNCQGGGFGQLRALVRVASSQHNYSYLFLTGRPRIYYLLTVKVCGWETEVSESSEQFEAVGS